MNMLLWFLLGFVISLLVRFWYTTPVKTNFSNSIFLGAMGAATGEAMSKVVNGNHLMYVSPMLYMLAGSIILIAWSLNNKVAN